MGDTTSAEPHAIITHDRHARPACHYCGRCGQGSDTGSKFTSVGTLLPIARATGPLTMFANSTTREVTINGGGRATGVAFIDRYTMRESSVKGRYVVLSGSAIETARYC